MIAVMFEAETTPGTQAEYPDHAARLRLLPDQIAGFILIERFASPSVPGKGLSLSFWRDEAAMTAWRSLPAHHKAQAAGRDHVFAGYRLRVAAMLRDYGTARRAEAPRDSV
ncbi:MAG: antibiotic biosynthesis monooxygenase [Paracoccus sp. (in: a-proteobacteria)]|uniref:antibiotic biosynthesis monooxygenase family protein n=1 Tax=Paracoccus sp. TaxID=267 RepID=UPI0026DF3F51|nr:antibiotic biosynthesis monooxygenase [Paracoccus sp. (in: a-proteobacteria)]MDO5630830.1 antibiotic biosynthesis monooxygenase [Paracoccus sp. (in: a-proteobacteria)]